VGKYIGEEIDGIFLDLPGYRLKITGGSDGSGVPMRGDISGNQRRRLLLTDSVGFTPVKDGQRKRKLIRGKNLSGDISQINLKVIEYGPKSIEELLKPEVA
jgi:small subunit ribosomal protein S6e